MDVEKQDAVIEFEVLLFNTLLHCFTFPLQVSALQAN